MRYLKLFESFEDIHQLCERFKINNYSINIDGSIDVDNTVNFTGIWPSSTYLSNDLKEIPINFGKVTGDFICYSNLLTTLKGAPKEVGSNFLCHHNHLSSLDGCPEYVGFDFVCGDNQLTSLEFCPEFVGNKFACYNNKLRTLETCPVKIKGNFECFNNKLTSLKGCPEEVGGSFLCMHNKLKVVDYLPREVLSGIFLSDNKIIDIKVLDKDISSRIYYGSLHDNPIDVLFKYWDGNLKEFIRDLDFEGFIQDNGKSVDIKRFEVALDGKKYDKRDIEKKYKLIINSSNY